MIISLGYGRKWIAWFLILIASIFFIRDYLQYINFLRLSNKESVIVSPAFSVHTSRKKREREREREREIKTVSVLTSLRCSVLP